MAQIISDDTLSTQFDEATKSVEAYTEAVLKSKGPFKGSAR